MALRIVSVAERPELADQGIPDGDVWPEYDLHGAVTTRPWRRLYHDLPAFQFVLVDDETDDVLAEEHTVPCWRDGDDGTRQRARRDP